MAFEMVEISLDDGTLETGNEVSVEEFPEGTQIRLPYVVLTLGNEVWRKLWNAAVRHMTNDEEPPQEIGPR